MKVSQGDGAGLHLEGEQEILLLGLRRIGLTAFGCRLAITIASGKKLSAATAGDARDAAAEKSYSSITNRFVAEAGLTSPTT